MLNSRTIDAFLRILSHALCVKNAEVETILTLYFGILLIIEEEYLSILASVENVVEIFAPDVVDFSFHRVWDVELMDTSEHSIIVQLPEANVCGFLIFLFAFRIGYCGSRAVVPR